MKELGKLGWKWRNWVFCLNRIRTVGYKRMRWKWLRNRIETEIEIWTAERDCFENLKAQYPAKSFGHEKLDLAIAILDLKIEIWQALNVF